MVWTSVTASPSCPTTTPAPAFFAAHRHSSSNGAFFAAQRPHPRWTTRRRGGRTDASAAVPDGVEGEGQANPCPPGTSTRAQLDLLEQLASNDSSGGYASGRSLTIREQLSELVRGRSGGEFTLPLTDDSLRKSVVGALSISQKRNIKRQAYLNEVSGRNDSKFFATVAAFVLLPPVLILLVAVFTGYVDLLPYRN